MMSYHVKFLIRVDVVSAFHKHVKQHNTISRIPLFSDTAIFKIPLFSDTAIVRLGGVMVTASYLK